MGKNILAYLAFSCAGKNKKKLAKLEEKIRSVCSAQGNKNVLIIGLELFILSRVRIEVLASQTKIRSFVTCRSAVDFFIELFSNTPE